MNAPDPSSTSTAKTHGSTTGGLLAIIHGTCTGLEIGLGSLKNYHTQYGRLPPGASAERLKEYLDPLSTFAGHLNWNSKEVQATEGQAEAADHITSAVKALSESLDVLAEFTANRATTDDGTVIVMTAQGPEFYMPGRTSVSGQWIDKQMPNGTAVVLPRDKLLSMASEHTAHVQTATNGRWTVSLEGLRGGRVLAVFKNESESDAVNNATEAEWTVQETTKGQGQGEGAKDTLATCTALIDAAIKSCSKLQRLATTAQNE
jgi:hypothetical protein